jgi:hypothetical protein
LPEADKSCFDGSGQAGELELMGAELPENRRQGSPQAE